MAYRFKGRATGCDPYGYFYPRWDKAQSVTVLAGTKREATAKAMQLLGDHPRFGNSRYYGWTVKWDEIEEVA